MWSDVTTDGGTTWTTAELGEGKDQENGRVWAWTLWQATVPVPPSAQGKPGETFEVACKAVDSSYNQQPEKASSVWNLWYSEQQLASCGGPVANDDE